MWVSMFTPIMKLNAEGQQMSKVKEEMNKGKEELHKGKEELHKAKGEVVQEVSNFAKWANENKASAMVSALIPVGAYAGYATYKFPHMRFGERFSKTGVLGQASVLASLLGAVTVLWVWQPNSKSARGL